MADIARRILARGSTSPPVCETADCFLFLFLSLSLSLSPLVCFLLPPLAPALSLPSNSKQNTKLHTHRKGAAHQLQPPKRTQPSPTDEQLLDPQSVLLAMCSVQHIIGK